MYKWMSFQILSRAGFLLLYSSSWRVIISTSMSLGCLKVYFIKYASTPPPWVPSTFLWHQYFLLDHFLERLWDLLISFFYRPRSNIFGPYKVSEVISFVSYLTWHCGLQFLPSTAVRQRRLMSNFSTKFPRSLYYSSVASSAETTSPKVSMSSISLPFKISKMWFCGILLAFNSSFPTIWTFLVQKVMFSTFQEVLQECVCEMVLSPSSFIMCFKHSKVTSRKK